MSVQVNTYLVLGVVLPFQKDERDAFAPYYDSAFEDIKNHEGICVLSDGMDGKYTIIGRVLAKTQNWKPFNGVVDIRALMPPASEIPEIERAIEDLVGSGEKQTARIILVSHYR